MIKYTSLFLLVFIFSLKNVKAQSTLDSNQLKKEYSSLEEALKAPEKVYRLDLSNQSFQLSDTIWSRFTNLEYLSLKNDHLKQIPAGVGNLKNLKVLDLSGNDFEVLPSTFNNLTNLQELFLNDDKYFKFEKNILILSTLPNLRTLHIENDGLEVLPLDMYRISHLESLYINNNQFKKFPLQLKEIKSLKYVDFHDNKYKMPRPDVLNEKYGIKIKF